LLLLRLSGIRQFTIDTTAVQPDEHVIFATYLRAKKLQIDVWDGITYFTQS
jgi:hypothetical protein